MKRVIIHTDGACKGNPGPCAYGSVLVCGRHRKEVSAGYRLTTNNRMELRAAITVGGLFALNWAALHPDQVAGHYVDIRSFPIPSSGLPTTLA